MRRSTAVAILAVLLAVLVAGAAPARAEVTASTLVPLTSPDYLPQSDTPALAADRAGRVMVVYLG